ncbi:MAG: hypothetical protein JJE51_07040 [Thermoanaerobaculia bacterium]|nr:hypothetical protein [Thermoanaerobaculia bacterium]
MFALVLAASLLTPDPCSDLCSRNAAHYYADLLQRGGYGRLPFEVAAFLIRESDGTLTTEPWPTRKFGHASYRGSIPKGAIAVLHTHPYTAPSPSAYDRAESRRISIPIIVITPMGVEAAYPDGSAGRVTGGAGWVERLTR